MVTNKTYARVSEVCILSRCLHNMLQTNILCLFLWPKHSSVYLTFLRNLSFHAAILDCSVQLEVELGVQKLEQPYYSSCSWFSFSHAAAQRSDLTRGASRVVGT